MRAWRSLKRHWRARSKPSGGARSDCANLTYHSGRQRHGGHRARHLGSMRAAAEAFTQRNAARAHSSISPASRPTHCLRQRPEVVKLLGTLAALAVRKNGKCSILRPSSRSPGHGGTVRRRVRGTPSSPDQGEVCLVLDSNRSGPTCRIALCRARHSPSLGRWLRAGKILYHGRARAAGFEFRRERSGRRPHRYRKRAGGELASLKRRVQSGQCSRCALARL